jgi:hypothetical protein
MGVPRFLPETHGSFRLCGAGEAGQMPAGQNRNTSSRESGAMCQWCGHVLTEEFPLFRLARRRARVARHSNPSKDIQGDSLLPYASLPLAAAKGLTQ